MSLKQLVKKYPVTIVTLSLILSLISTLVIQDKIYALSEEKGNEDCHCDSTRCENYLTEEEATNVVENSSCKDSSSLLVSDYCDCSISAPKIAKTRYFQICRPKEVGGCCCGEWDCDYECTPTECKYITYSFVKCSGSQGDCGKCIFDVATPCGSGC